MSSENEEAPLWERSKENTAPIERGRNIASLEASLQTSEVEKQHQIELFRQEINRRRLQQQQQQQQEAFGNQVDVLDPWIRLIQYVQTSYPSSNHIELLEECVLEFHQHEKYQQDSRFVKVCCLYASLERQEPLLIFDRLYQVGIGTTQSIFWAAWAWQAERCQEYELAQRLLECGIHEYRAYPPDLLPQRYQQFQRRQRRRMIQQQEQQQTYDDVDSSTSGLRSTLGQLTLSGIRRDDRSSTATVGSRLSSTSTAPSATGRTTLSTFTHREAETRATDHSRPTNQANRNIDVYVETAEEMEPQSFQLFLASRQQHRREQDLQTSRRLDSDRGEPTSLSLRAARLERQAERRKENLLLAEAWNHRGGLASTTSGAAGGRLGGPPSQTSTTSALEVFVDPECAEQHQREESNRKQALQDHQHWLRGADGSRMKDATAAPTSKLGKKKKDAAPVWWQVPGAAFQTHLLTDATTGKEQSLEEARANALYYTALPVIPPIDAEASFESSMSMMDMSASVVASQEDDTASTAERHEMMDSSHITAASGRIDSITGTSTPRNHVNASLNSSADASDSMANGAATKGAPTPTINTQWALKELSMMFCSSPGGAADRNDPPNSHSRRHDDNSTDDDRETSQSLVGDGANLSNDLPAHHPTDSISSMARLRKPPRPNYLFSDDGVDKRLSAHSMAQRKGIGGFSIYRDDSDEVDDSARVCASVATAGPRRPTNAFEEKLGQSQAAGFVMYEDDDDSHESAPFAAAIQKSTPLRDSAPEHGHTDIDQANRSYDGAGECATATFSVYQELFGSEPETNGLLENDGSATASWNEIRDIQSDRVAGRLSTMRDDVTLPAFGDVSCIVPTEHDVTSTTVALALAQAIKYRELHEADTQLASQGLLSRSRSHLPTGSDSNPMLSDLMSKSGFLCHCPSLTLPRMLKLSSSDFGAGAEDVRLGRFVAPAATELGRGAYGLVTLLKNGNNAHSEHVAVKAQKPAGCLAWEYEVLRRLQSRLKDKGSGKGHCPFFPVALSYVSLADGALLGMTAGLTKPSCSINLVDLANAYYVKFGKRGIPEILAFYYTSRMLYVLELLHWKGKVLHCDAKPDNWVLVTSRDPSWSNVEASDVMLVDFGRAVDLESAKSMTTPVMEVKLVGEATSKDMMCAAMRQGLPWSFDLDTYGICASAHVLLFGEHMQLQRRQPNARWMPKQPFKRYFHQDLWNQIFETLLNVDEITRIAIDSRPASLRILRQQVEAYLSTNVDKLREALQRQSTILPERRQDLMM